MYGGVAQSYCRWQMQGDPFKEGKVYYIYAINPSTKLPKKIRFYTDKAHADLMPNKVEATPLWKIFGFQNENSEILLIKERYLNEDEIDRFFKNKWRASAIFGGCWYAPIDMEIPAIRNNTKITRCSWPAFKNESKVYTKMMGFTNGIWQEEN